MKSPVVPNGADFDMIDAAPEITSNLAPLFLGGDSLKEPGKVLTLPSTPSGTSCASRSKSRLV